MLLKRNQYLIRNRHQKNIRKTNRETIKALKNRHKYLSTPIANAYFCPTCPKQKEILKKHR